MSEEPLSLEALWDEAWSRLEEGARSRKSEFHFLTLATLGHHGPEARTLILRGASREEGTVRVHTDRRAPKAAEILSDPRCAILLYGPGARLQIRGRGMAEIHQDDDLALGAWSETSLLSRRCYLAPQPPGTILDRPGSGLPPHLESREPEPEESEGGLEEFAVILISVQEMDIMSLAAHGHRRSLWKRDGEGWTGCWATP